MVWRQGTGRTHTALLDRQMEQLIRLTLTALYEALTAQYTRLMQTV
ncbi:hypothetical protein ACW0Z6_000945 [Vibrio alginolyticus]